MRNRASLVLIRNDALLLIQRNKAGLEYYVFTGGGLNPGELPDSGVVREALEEGGIEVIPVRELFYLEGEDGARNTFILCSQEGSAELIWQEYEENERQSADNRYAFVWMPLKGLRGMRLLPYEARDQIRALYPG